jgi:hypothetical protein
MLHINDCAVCYCGAYFQSDGYCANGHPHTNIEPGFHNVQPGQTCRIVTVQIAVAADSHPYAVADEISNMLTGGIVDPESCILDWGYLPGRGPEDGNLARASAEPVENEIFEPECQVTEHKVTFDPQAAAAVIRRTFEKLQEALGDDDADELPMRVEIALEALVACARPVGKPEPKPREYRYIVTRAGEEYALVTDTGDGPAYHGPWTTEAGRDEFLRTQFDSGELDFVEDTIFCLDFSDGKLIHIWMPDLPEAENE